MRCTPRQGGRLDQHSASLTNPPSAEWLSRAAALAQQIMELPGGKAVASWVSGTSVRAHFMPDAVSAHDARKAIAEVSRLTTEKEKVSREVEIVRKRNNDLFAKLNAAKEEARIARENAQKTQAKLDEIMAAALPSVPERIEHDLRVVLVKNSETDLFIDPHIPPHKLFNAEQRCNVPVTEKVIALLDLTVFGSAKDAIVFGTTVLYHHCKSSQMYLAYSELPLLRAEVGTSELKFFPVGDSNL
jgi:hypothetical protein